MSPANGHDDFCTGHGSAEMTTLHGYKASGSPSTTATLWLQISTGTCVGPFGFSMMAELSGWCESTTGWGLTDSGHYFTLAGSGHKLVAFGEAIGTIELHAVNLVLPCEPFVGNIYQATIALALTH